MPHWKLSPCMKRTTGSWELVSSAENISNIPDVGYLGWFRLERLTCGRSVNIQIQTIFRLILEQENTPPHGRQSSLGQGGEGGGPVGQLRQQLRADRGELVRQQGLLPRRHRHRGHEPQVAQGGSREGDAQEGGDWLEVVGRLVDHALDGAVLGLDVPEGRLPARHQDHQEESLGEHPGAGSHHIRSFSFNQTNDNLSGRDHQPPTSSLLPTFSSYLIISLFFPLIC